MFTPSPAARPDQRADHAEIQRLFEEYITLYAGRDDRLTTCFSEDFSGFTGGGDFLVDDRAEWVAITRQDFAQVKEPLRIEHKDLRIQPLSATIAVVTAFFAIHLPIKDHVLSRETARLVLVFHREAGNWKIAHSSISIPYHLVRAGEVYPMQALTERNQELENLVAERTVQLQTSEGRYRSILAASPDDITITDKDGRILMVSPSAYTLFGYERTTAFDQRTVLDFIVPEERPLARQHWVDRLEGRRKGPAEYRGLRADGSTIAIEVNAEFIRDAAGAPTGMVIIIRDLTERKKADAERERLEALNQQLQKAESLGRMAGAIAHTFNNQLHTVMMSLDLALGDLRREDGPGPAQKINLALSAARKAAEVSSQMLTYLGQSAATRQSLDLAETCRRGLGLVQAAMPPEVKLATAFPCPGPLVHADARQLQHVVTNLVTNAWEASGAAPCVVNLAIKTVDAAALPTENRVPLEFQPQGTTYACLEVADEGCGIPAPDIGKVFDPFFTTKFTGRGLGLAMVLGMVRANKGAIAVESAPQRGTVFRVYLPVVAR
ncbi:Sensor histidine kinase TmoS [Lacunisphaera limnophila]|uniref:histidine kinase n=1 Tax=Lacunisphaera limnophila TaxID=1838286 RepID=A0A1D8AV25_9BACT|nr:PAS domain S-box protein [Lacunisphaera limnophila]AOS44733.1 Sensor histidine kinase TmoS [Lacunisphaera limnophila]